MRASCPAELAGYYSGGNYNDFGTNANFWSATEYGSISAYDLVLGDGIANVFSGNKGYAFSVRCLKDSK